MKVHLLVWLDRLCAWPVLLYRFCKVGCTFRRIYLGEGIWTILDEEDYYRLRSFKWIVHGSGRSGENLYAVRFKLVEPYKTTLVSMHREIMKPTDNRFVDHINCNSLDNRRSNLRFVTRTQNGQNRRKKKNTTSRFVGVNFSKPESKWRCRISYQGKRIQLGRFASEIAAARAYDQAAKKYYGEFARLNFPQKAKKEKSTLPSLRQASRYGLRDTNDEIRATNYHCASAYGPM